MDKNYLQEVELAFLKKILLNKLGKSNYYDENNSIVFDFYSIENYANNGIDLFPLLNILEKKLDVNISITIHDDDYGNPKPIVFKSFNDFSKSFDDSSQISYLVKYNDIFYSKDGKYLGIDERFNKLFDMALKMGTWWLPLISIEIENLTVIKDKIKQLLDEYIATYEIGDLSGTNIFSLELHSQFVLKLLDSLNNLDQRNLFIDSKVIENSLTDLYDSSIKTKSQMRLLEHFLLFEKKDYLKIKNIDFSERGSTIPWNISISLTTPLNVIAEREKISLQESDKKEEKNKMSKKSSKIPVFNEKLRKISFNGREWTLKTKHSKQFYVLRILLSQRPGTQMTIKEIIERYRNDDDAQEIFKSNSGRWVEDLVRDINANAKNHLEIDELLRCKGSTIEYLKI